MLLTYYYLTSPPQSPAGEALGEGGGCWGTPKERRGGIHGRGAGTGIRPQQQGKDGSLKSLEVGRQAEGIVTVQGRGPSLTAAGYLPRAALCRAEKQRTLHLIKVGTSLSKTQLSRFDI